MKRLHLSILILFSWFFVFYNIERLFETINLASFVYFVAPAMSFLVLAVPRFVKAPAYSYFLAAATGVVVCRSLLGYPIDGEATSLIVTEVAAIGIMILCTSRLAKDIEEYRSSAVTAIAGHLAEGCQPFEAAEKEIVREVRRARHSGRNIAVLAMRPQAPTDSQVLDRFADEFKQRLIQKYILSRTAACMSKGLRQHDILTEGQDDFLLLMPELSRAEAHEVATDLCRNVRDQLGIEMQFGISMFPEEEVTAIGLIERAEAAVHQWHSTASIATSNLLRASERTTSMRTEAMKASAEREVEACRS